MLTTQRPGLYIISEKIKKRCIYCSENIESGSIIELCPVILLNKEDTLAIHNTFLHDYYFVWDLEAGTSAIALGYGSIYNHSDDPNADFELVRETHMIRIQAIKDIPAGTEITLDYIGLKDQTVANLWFDRLLPDCIR